MVITSIFFKIQGINRKLAKIIYSDATCRPFQSWLMLKDSLICIRQTKPTQVSNIFRSQLKLVDVSGSSQIQTMTGSKGCLNVPYPPTADNDGHTSFELFLSVESCQNNLQTLFTDITKTGENDYHREESVSQQPKPSN